MTKSDNVLLMKNNRSIIFTILFIIFTASGVLGLINYRQSSRTERGSVVQEEIIEIESADINDTESMAEVLIDPESVESIMMIAEEDDLTAFDLLLQHEEVTFKEYDFGKFIESINGVSGNDQYFWAFYINGEKATQGADQTMLKNGDQVEWRYERIE